MGGGERRPCSTLGGPWSNSSAPSCPSSRVSNIRVQIPMSRIKSRRRSRKRVSRHTVYQFNNDGGLFSTRSKSNEPRSVEDREGSPSPTGGKVQTSRQDEERRIDTPSVGSKCVSGDAAHHHTLLPIDARRPLGAKRHLVKGTRPSSSRRSLNRGDHTNNDDNIRSACRHVVYTVALT
jgi:hypothetical protein